jgi:D-alanyl-D-alanine carboxypeptidase/D-alanyl-D-alanine-endopeptidase (penicillin-binding protein 4)
MVLVVMASPIGTEKSFERRSLVSGLSMIVWYGFVLFLLTACVSTQPGARITPLDSLRRDLDHLIRDKRFASAHIGVSVQTLRAGEAIYEFNERKTFIPASIMKLFTTAAAVSYLSPSFKFTTTMYTDGDITDGTLRGNVILKGTGDPTLGSKYFHGEYADGLKDLAKALRNLGVRRIGGDILVDDSYFNATPLGRGWSWDDEPFCFSAKRSALVYQDNCVEVLVLPGPDEGAPASLRTEPDTDALRIVNLVTTGEEGNEADLELSRDMRADVVILSGVIPADSEGISLSIAVGDPAYFAAAMFRSHLTEANIILAGLPSGRRQEAQTDPSKRTFRGSFSSPTLSEILKVVNKRSRNLPAEQLFLALGSEVKGSARAEEAVEAVQEFLEDNNIDVRNFHMVDGSGLSRYNLVTPGTVVDLLRVVAEKSYFAPFYDSLSIAGVDGTLQHRTKGTPCENNLRGKTGSMNRISNLAGYVATRDGEVMVFSFMCNHHTVDRSSVDDLYTSLCARLAGFSRETK